MPDPICSQCHNTTFHFDRARHAVVCDVCGWEQNRSERVNELLVYDQQRQKAIAFVKARDYAAARPFLERMRSIKPDDPDIYYLHLMGLTDCCQNLLLEPADARTYALVQSNWNTFCTLRGDRRIFLSYFRRRAIEAKKRQEQDIAKATCTALACYVPLLAFLALTLSEAYWFAVPLIINAMIAVRLKPLQALFSALRRKE